MIANIAPDRIVTISGTGSATVTGSYPDFIIDASTGVIYTAGTGISISNGVITNTNPNQNQTLLLNGNILTISNGNSITLPDTNTQEKQLQSLIYTTNGF